MNVIAPAVEETQQQAIPKWEPDDEE